MRTLLIALFVLVVLGGLAACAWRAPLKTFNLLVPKDSGVSRIATNVAYAPGARRGIDIYSSDKSGQPVAIFFYGGSWDSGEKEDVAFAAKAIAARGFTVFVPDYRLVPGVLFPTFLEDCAAAVRWAQDHAAAYGADPSRIVLIGHSAGAYNALMLTLDQRYLASAGVNAEAIRGAAGLSGPYDFYPFDVDASKAAFGKAPDPLQTQPIHFARADAPPILLLHGDADTLVRPRNTINLAARLTALGAPVESKLYPGADHAYTLISLSRPFRNKAPVLDDAAAFLTRVTQN